ncbi:MAG: protease SohB [Gammaproteobacteria bacterium]|nr:protease SohB [Gammaproteobacteria bacterium]
MTEFFTDYGLFLAKTITLIATILATVFVIVAVTGRSREEGREKLEIKKLNDKYRQMAHLLHTRILPKTDLKKYLHQEKKIEKKLAKDTTPRRRIFVLNFDGDIRASAVTSLREEITAILMIATPNDEVVVRIHSGGGMVHAYGLAASQLMRIKQHNIPLTVAIDKIAASGGYLMACVANHIIAAPFAIVGSIGVIAQVPNFHRLLKKHDIDFEQITAGEYKRTLTIFGENTDKGRAKFKEEIEDTHSLFKEFIREHRPQVDVELVGSGEHWPAKRGMQLKLVDELMASDDYLMSKRENADLFEITYRQRLPLAARLGHFIQGNVDKLLNS